MRILVVSDTHGDYYNFKKVLDAHKDAQVVIHCGDSRDELDSVQMYYPDKAFICVKGNCDLGSLLPTTESRTIEGKRFFITHGHLYNVKSTLYPLCCKAREENADFVLFGHTHNATDICDDTLHIINPGSLKGYNGTYAYIDISDSGVMTNIVKLK